MPVSTVTYSVRLSTSEQNSKTVSSPSWLDPHTADRQLQVYTVLQNDVSMQAVHQPAGCASWHKSVTPEISKLDT